MPLRSGMPLDFDHTFVAVYVSMYGHCAKKNQDSEDKVCIYQKRILNMSPHKQFYCKHLRGAPLCPLSNKGL